MPRKDVIGRITPGKSPSSRCTTTRVLGWTIVYPEHDATVQRDDACINLITKKDLRPGELLSDYRNGRIVTTAAAVQDHFQHDAILHCQLAVRDGGHNDLLSRLTSSAAIIHR